MDNSAIERIAAADLTDDVMALLERHRDNDGVIFFLARFIWQGEIAACLPVLQGIAVDPGRGRYARLTSIRAVMTVGTIEQGYALWDTIASHPGPLDRRLLAELIDVAEPSSRSVELLLRSLETVAPADRIESVGLTHSIHGFIERLPIMSDTAKEQPIAELADGLNAFLDREPHIERGECHVSKELVWLMGPALHCVDRLVAAKAGRSLDASAIAILRKLPAVSFWGHQDLGDYKSGLGQNVPRWQELNDKLYWTSIAERRAHLVGKGERLIDDWQSAFLGHFWSFGIDDFDRCLEWVATKLDLDDRLVALSRSFQLYLLAERPAAWLARLHGAVAGEEELEKALENHLQPKRSPALEKMEKEDLEWRRKQDERERAEQHYHAEWVAELRTNPDRVRHPTKLKPGDFSNDQYHLLHSIGSDSSPNYRDHGANWSALIPEFGEAVATAYRDAALAHWRAYDVPLRSEGADTGSTPYSLIFGMAGLSIEARESDIFPAGLSEADVRQALRYITWELNGFPHWFEPLYRAHPKIAFEAVRKELLWELDHHKADVPLHYVLHDILYYAPWLHAEVAPVIYQWLLAQDVPNLDGLRYSLGILSGGGMAPDALAELARKKLEKSSFGWQRPRWFALWIDTEPDTGVPALEHELDSLAADSSEAASDFAQQSIVALLGDRHGTGSRALAFRTPAHLKSLYVLMHRYVRVADDIERAGKGVYSPTLRDNAQDARNSLFNMLFEVPGEETYAAIRALERDHPEPNYRRWMARRARQRAVEDSDEPLWSVEDVHAFANLK